MALRDPIGVWFSELKDNWEECGFHWLSWGQRKDERYRRYGDLPDGRHFGAGFVPAFGDPWGRESAIVIVGETGELQHDTPSWIKEWNRWPAAVAVSPSGRSLVWLTEEKSLRSWHQEAEDFVLWDGSSLNQRLDDCRVLDAMMRPDGILELRLEDGRRMGYLCDADLVLFPWEDCWIPANKEESPCRNAEFPDINRVDCWPDSFAVMVRSEDDEYDYYSCGVRRVCFEPGLEVIKPGMLADNPELKSVTIPASVKEVKTWAFGCCTNLKNLVIEGDPLRAAAWAEDAFQGCACEEYYRQLRNKVETI